MVTGIIGKKVGMTQLFLEDGTLEPATVLQAGPCIVVQSKSVNTDGYDAVQLAFATAPKVVSKPMQGHYAKAGAPLARAPHPKGPVLMLTSGSIKSLYSRLQSAQSRIASVRGRAVRSE